MPPQMLPMLSCKFKLILKTALTIKIMPWTALSLQNCKLGKPKKEDQMPQNLPIQLKPFQLCNKEIALNTVILSKLIHAITKCQTPLAMLQLQTPLTMLQLHLKLLPMLLRMLPWYK